MAARRLVALVALVSIVSLAQGVHALAGTVHLKNGGWVEGELMEVVPDQHVLVRLSDGTVRDVPWAEVDHVERDGDASPARAPVAVPIAQQARVPPPAAEAAEAPPSVAVAAQDDAGRATRPAIGPTLAILGVTGFGGGIHESVTTNENGIQGADVGKGDLAPTYGGAVHFNMPLHPFVSLGALVRLLSFRSDTATQRSLMLDGAVAPRAQYVFEAGGTRGAIFLQVPVGVGWVHVPKPSSLPAGTAVTWETNPAFVFGVGGGLQMLLTRTVGLTLDVSWLHHSFDYHIAGVVSGTSTSADFSFQINQVVFQGGLLFEL